MIQHHIDKAKNGDQSSSKWLYNELKVSYFKLVLLYIKDRDTAQDVLQEGFIQMFRKLDYYDSEKGSLETWGRKIMVNTCLQHLRKHKKWQKITDLNETILDVQANYERSAIANMSLRDIYDVIYKLPEGYRMVFNLYVIEGYPHKEIAQMLDISENTSKSQLSKAKSRLRKMVHKYLPEYSHYGEALRT